MRKLAVAVTLVLWSTSQIACVSKSTMLQTEINLNKEVNCTTAEADIRILEEEKAHVAQQIAAGVSAIAPIGLVVNVIRKTEKRQIKIATGKYNRMIDEKIAQIKRECGVQ